MDDPLSKGQIFIHTKSLKNEKVIINCFPVLLRITTGS